MRWIINKKIYEPFQFVGSVAINILNMTIMMLVLDMFFRVVKAKNTDWYHTAVNQMTESDNFFQDKVDLIFYTLGAVVIVLGIFCTIILWLFRKQQNGKAASQAGIFLACGYPKRKVQCYLAADGIADAVLALMAAYGAFHVILSVMIKNEVFQAIYRITGHDRLISIWAMLLTGVLFTAVIILQASAWVAKTDLEGIAVLIRKK